MKTPLYASHYWSWPGRWPWVFRFRETSTSRPVYTLLISLILSKGIKLISTYGLEEYAHELEEQEIKSRRPCAYSQAAVRRKSLPVLGKLKQPALD